MLLAVWLGTKFPTLGVDPQNWPGQTGWTWILLGYAFLASVLPVWSLLQARDFLNSLLLYLGLLATYGGFFVLGPTFAAPAVALHPEGPPPLFPFVFIVIACGAAGGFHALVSSGTTAKQINTETDARFIGYGGMIGESLLGLTLLVATLYIHQRGRNPWFTGLPMAFMLISTFTSLIENLASFLDKGQYLLLAVGSALLVVGAGIVVEGIRAFVRRQRHTDDSITFADDT